MSSGGAGGAGRPLAPRGGRAKPVLAPPPVVPAEDGLGGTAVCVCVCMCVRVYVCACVEGKDRVRDGVWHDFLCEQDILD